MTRKLTNRLNDLDSKTWLKFQKSWFVHNPPPRQKQVLRHPGKFPESLAQEFIEFFTKRGQWVLDPMVGTGSTLVAALRCGRNSIGIELNEAYAQLARNTLAIEQQNRNEPDLECRVFSGDAAHTAAVLQAAQLPLIDYVITSPPYWDMLHAPGARTQRTRRATPELDVYYSQNPDDLGNIHEYDHFLERLVDVYANLRSCLRPKAYITIIVKNVKKGGKVYPLAWDLGRLLGQHYRLKDERIWCQDNQSLAPFGLGNAWVSNTHHHYCLQFRYE